MYVPNESTYKSLFLTKWECCNGPKCVWTISDLSILKVLHLLKNLIKLFFTILEVFWNVGPKRFKFSWHCTPCGHYQNTDVNHTCDITFRRISKPIDLTTQICWNLYQLTGAEPHPIYRLANMAICRIASKIDQSKF